MRPQTGSRALASGRAPRAPTEEYQASAVAGNAPKPAYLAIRGLTKRFGAFAALENISLDIAKGEFVCFLGPSGCGKTTLLRCIAGLDLQTSGTIHQSGRDITVLPPASRDFGIVFQSFALFPNLSVEGNVGYGLKSRGLDKGAIRTRVDQLLDLVGLPGSGRKYPVQLSGGQQQRVAVARALALEPGLLLLDEPLSALDARVRVHLRHEIKALHRRLGITTIMVTHDQEEALTMADRIVVMNHGVIEQVGAPEDLYRRPASAFVADFVGTMNFLAGTLIAAGRVRLGTAEIACTADGPALGSEVCLCLRPEDIQVRGLGAASPNRLMAEIVEIDFLGSFCRATLKLESAPDWELLADFSINLMRDFDIVPGRRLEIALPPDRLRLFTTGTGRFLPARPGD